MSKHRFEPASVHKETTRPAQYDSSKQDAPAYVEKENLKEKIVTEAKRIASREVSSVVYLVDAVEALEKFEQANS